VFEWFGKINFTPHTRVTDFADHLKDGYLMGSKCKNCGFETYPPRANCPKCLSPDFEYHEISGQGTLLTYTQIAAAPTGFQDIGAYRVGLVDLKEGGRAVAWIGETIGEDEVKIGMELQLVPRIFENTPDIKVYYTLEKPGTTWGKAPRPNRG